MGGRLVRGLGLAFGIAGAATLWGGTRHLLLASQEDVYVDFHRSSGWLLIAAGALLFISGLRLLVTPAAWAGYPFFTKARFWGWLLLGLLGIFCVLGAWMPGQDLARYPCRAACVLWCALLTLPVLLPANWVQRLGLIFQSRAGRLVDLAVGNVVVIAILLELGLRGLALWSGQDALLLNRTAGYRLTPGVYPNGLRANSLGFADEEWSKEKRSGTLRIAALGDSFSAGTGVAYEDNYLTRLETELTGIEVLNFGVCGTGPREYQQLLASQVWAYQPDLVLVPIFIGNDITEWIATPELVRFHPDALYLELLGRRLYRVAREQWRAASAEQAKDGRMGTGPRFSEKTYLELTAGRLVVCRAQQNRTDEDRWRLVETNLTRLIDDCRAHAVPVAFVLIADEFQVNDELRKRALAQRGWRERDVDLMLPQRRLTAYCQQQGVPCLDLYHDMKWAGGAAHLRNDGHFSVHGHHLAATQVAAWLREEFDAIKASGVALAPRE